MSQTLPRNRNTAFPFDPFHGEHGIGDPDDQARYILTPGEQFLQPWLRVPNGQTFVWPVGVEGFNDSIEPTVGVRKFIGDNDVAVQVMHLSEERLRMTGEFPGSTSVNAYRALRDVVRARTPAGGKILYVPHILAYAQRVVVARAEFDRPQDDIGDLRLTYTVEFVRIGSAGEADNPPLEDPLSQPYTPKEPRGNSPVPFLVNSKYNTLRKIAKYKLGSTGKWRQLYDKNTKLFRKLKVPMAKVPDYRLPIGTRVNL
jgi:hypothetical protein